MEAMLPDPPGLRLHGADKSSSGALPQVLIRTGGLPSRVGSRPRPSDSKSSTVERAAGSLTKRVLAPRCPPNIASPRCQGSAGYIFCCGDEMLLDCHRLCLFGAPFADLGQMMQNITPETQIFLFNVDNLTLIGRFTVDGTPRFEIEPEAFNTGDFRAQVRVKPLDLSLMEAELDDWIESGPILEEEVETLKARLRRGRPADFNADCEAASPDFDGSQTGAESSKKRKREATSSRQIVKTESTDDPCETSILPLGTSCWDFQSGNCTRGQSCRFRHSKDEPLAESSGDCSAEDDSGYLFLCSNATQKECFSLKLLGSPDREMSRMKQTITPGTRLLLLNIQSMMLFGPLAALDLPNMHVIPGAFGGKFNAQVHFELVDDLLFEMKVERRIPGGPKTCAEIKSFVEKLEEQGQFVDESLLSDCHPAGSTEPFCKRLKREQPAREPALTRHRLVKSEQHDDDDGNDSIDRASAGELEQGSCNTSSLCWDFSRGHCPRGDACRYSHVQGTAKGYVFLCNTRTQLECGSSGVLGSPLKELPLMKQFINDETQLFLFNFQTQTLVGTFSSVSEAEKNIKPGAFNGKFSAQVSVVPMDQPLLAAKFEKRVTAGPKSGAEVEELIARLAEGELASAEVQEAWGTL